MREESITKSMPEQAAAAISAAHLLHPAEHFCHPRDVLAAEHIGNDEKRAILASWASDIFAIESVPALHLYSGTNKAVSYDEIIEALKTLDRDDEDRGEQGSSGSFSTHATPHWRPQPRRFGSLSLRSYRRGGAAKSRSRSRPYL